MDIRKKTYTKQDYEYVLNKILESWSSGIPPDTMRIMRELHKNKKRMDEEYEFYKEMDE